MSQKNSSQPTLPSFTIFKRRKNYFDCEKNTKFQQKKAIANEAKKFQDFCKSFGLRINEIILGPNEGNDEDNLAPKITVLSCNLSDVKKTFKFLKAKDLAHMSHKSYSVQRQTLSDFQRIPDLHKLSKLQHKLNRFFKIQKNDYGYFSLPEQKIKYVCESFLLNNPGFSNTSFKIKLSTDSTSITSSQINLLNFSFNLIDDIEKAMSINGTYMLGSFEVVKEDYGQVKESLRELLILLEKIKFIEIADITYKIDFYLCCDYKMNRILYGQKASNSLDGY
jgi:hypothetical protein